MSIKLMNAAWELQMPAGQKFVLVALCDQASDAGDCYPSISTIAMRCSMGERTVQRHIKDLEDAGYLERIERIGRSTIYRINPRQFGTPADLAPPPKTAETPANLAPTPANLAPAPANLAPITITQPSPNHKGTNKGDSFALPDWIPAETWQAFMLCRRQAKDADTDYAHRLLIKQLERIKAAGHDPVEAIETSIRSGWKDVYMPRSAANEPGGKHSAHSGFAGKDYSKGVTADGRLA